MGLPKRISLAFLIIIAAFAIATHIGLDATLWPTFEALESRAANDDLTRARSGINNHLDILSTTTADWAHWDYSHDYVLGNAPGFESSNLDADTLLNLDVDLMALFDADRQLRWGLFLRGSAEQNPNIVDVAGADSIELLQRHDEPESEIKGLIDTAEGPMLISARPIVHSDTSGPIAGTMIIGRLIDRNRVALLQQSVEVALSVEPLRGDKQHLAEQQTESIFGAIKIGITDQYRMSRQRLHDIHGSSVAELVVATPRDITLLGQNTSRSVAILLGGLGAVIIVGLWVVLERTVIGPISQLREKMTSVEVHQDLSERVNLKRDDEIGDMARSFDSMMQQLEDARRENIDQSFRAGMAEVAAGILHNIRNSLMPIQNHVAIAEDALDDAAQENVMQALRELRDESTPATRREKLHRFLRAARDRGDELRNDIAENLHLAQQQLMQVLRILEEQEKHTHAKPILESVNVGSAVAEALGVVAAPDSVSIEFDIDDSLGTYSVHAHRVSLVQVFSNLLINAYESIERAGRGRGCIAISAEPCGDASDRVINILVRDSGTGIQATELRHIFDRGFTVKEDGRGGLGLHWTSNALASMNGSIAAASDGVDRGAEFRVTLLAA